MVPVSNVNCGVPVTVTGSLNVTVTEGSNKYATDLSEEDFEVYEDNKIQAVESFKFIKVEGNPGEGDYAKQIRTTYDEEQELAPKIRGRTLTPDAALRDWLEHNGLKPANGPVIVNGATGGVGLAAHLEDVRHRRREVAPQQLPVGHVHRHALARDGRRAGSESRRSRIHFAPARAAREPQEVSMSPDAAANLGRRRRGVGRDENR